MAKACKLFAAASIPHLIAAGQEVTIELVTAKLSSLKPLISGSYKPHLAIEVAPGKTRHDVNLVTLRPTMCFGTYIEPDKTIAKLTFAGPQSPELKKRLATALIAGRLSLIERNPAEVIVDTPPEPADEPAPVAEPAAEPVDEPAPVEQPPADDAPALE